MNIADIEKICDNLIEQELDFQDEGDGKKFNKDRLMIINNLCQYLTPKQATTSAMPGGESDEEIQIEYINEGDAITEET